MQRLRAAAGVRRRFWLPSAVAIVGALALGLVLPRVDDAVDVDPGVLALTDPSAVRSLLESIATVSISVAVAMLWALGAVGCFVAFVQNTVTSLQASTVIARIRSQATAALDERHPVGLGEQCDAPLQASRPSTSAPTTPAT